MVIAVNIRSLLPGIADGSSNFIVGCVSRLAKKYPQHRFIYITDRAYDEQLITSKYITAVVTGPQANSPLLWQYWYNYKLPAALRKHKADVLISAGGFISLRTKVPQLLVLNELIYLHQPELFAKSHLRFYKKFMPVFLQKAKSIVTLSEFAKTTITSNYKIEADKTNVVYDGPDEIFKPVSLIEKESVKEKYSEGKEYFLYSGSIGIGTNMMNLLKAFSFFKKRQKSNMQMLIATAPEKSFTESLKTFKYRADVKILIGLQKEELAIITAAAYAMIYPSLFTGFALPLPEAMQCEVPVITSKAGALQEMCGDAALYADSNNFEDIADKMMLLFKDETKRNELIKKGEKQVKIFSKDKAADLLWQSVLKAIEQ